MAINDIKIKSHDIYLERNGDKGGNLIIGASTTTNSLTVNTNTINKGDLTVNGNTTTNSLTVNTNTNNNGNLTVSGTITGNTVSVGSGGLTVNGTISGNTVVVGIGGLAVSGNTIINSLAVNTNTINNGDLTVSGSTTTNSLTINTNTLNKGDISVYGNIKVYGNNTISCNQTLTLTGSQTNLKLGNNITISTPTLFLNTNKIDIERRSGNNPINIDDLIQYTPSTIPAGMYKSWRYKKECELDVVCNDDRSDFKHTTKFESVGGFQTEVKYYNIVIFNSKFITNTELTEFKKYYDEGNLTFKLTVKVSVTDTYPDQVIVLSKDVVKLDTRNKILRIQADNKSNEHPDFDKLNSISENNLGIKSVTFTASFVGENAIIAIDKSSTMQINENQHVLLNCASTATTNISYFPNTAYSEDYQKLVVVTANSVSLRPGDFIEFYPTFTGSCYLFCDALGYNTNNIFELNTTAGCIYYEPAGKKAYIYSYGNSTVIGKDVISTGSTLLIKFHNNTNPYTGLAREFIIKR